MERFWNKVNKKSPEECWEWTAYKMSRGYGVITVDSKTVLAHRMSWILTYGHIPQGEGYHGTCVLHKCDNPACVNPNHLFLGTVHDNNNDKVQKGRSRTGPTKFTWEDIDNIRDAYPKQSQHALAKLYNVTQTAICKIVNNKTWVRCEGGSYHRN